MQIDRLLYNKTIDDILSISRLLMIKEPYYALVMMNICKTVSNSGQTAWVSPKRHAIEFGVNPEFWNTLTTDYKYGIIKHELLHICFGHLTNFRKIQEENSTLANIAMDMAINQYIKSEQLIDGAVRLEEFNKNLNLNMAPKESAKYYYDEIKKWGNDHSTEFDSLMAMYGSLEHAWKIINTEGVDSDVMRDVLKQNIDRILKSVATNCPGNVPGEIQSILDALKNRAKEVVNWRTVLQSFAHQAPCSEVTTTRRKPNKRFFGQPALKIKETSRLLICVDTSGSVSDKMLQLFFAQIDIMIEAGCTVDVLQFDCGINSIESYKKGLDIKINGRGGTSFNEPLEYYQKNYRMYDGCVIFTDGYASIPEVPFAMAKLLWLIYRNETAELGGYAQPLEDYPGSAVQVTEELIKDSF